MSKKTKFIESYIFAKQLNMLCENLQFSPFKADSFLITASELSYSLLEKSKLILGKWKFNDLTLSILDKDISQTSYYSTQEENYNLLCKMMKSYNKHFEIINNYANYSFKAMQQLKKGYI